MGNFVKDHFGDYKSYQEEIKRLENNNKTKHET